jgi:hypothetical protein
MQSQASMVARDILRLFLINPITFAKQADALILNAEDRHAAAEQTVNILLNEALKTPCDNWTRTAAIDYARELALEYGYPNDNEHGQTLINLVTAAGITNRFAELVQKVFRRNVSEMDVVTLVRAYCDSNTKSPSTESDLKALIKGFCSEDMAKQIYEMRSSVGGRSWMLEKSSD